SCALQLGVRFAGERVLFGTRVGDELTWALGAVGELWRRGGLGVDLIAEAQGAAGPADESRPAEVRGAVRLGFGAWLLDLGGGGGVTSAVALPTYRIFLVFRGRMG